MKILIITICGVFLTQQAIAQECKSQKVEQWQKFKKEEGEDWKVNWHRNTPRIIYGGLTKPYPGSGEIAARSFLKDYHELFSFDKDLSDLKYMDTREHRGVQHVTFVQTYKNLPVEDAEFKVHIRENGSIDLANGLYYPIINLSTIPTLAKTDAFDIVLKDMNLEYSKNIKLSASQVIYPQNDSTFFLAL